MRDARIANLQRLSKEQQRYFKSGKTIKLKKKITNTTFKKVPLTVG